MARTRREQHRLKIIGYLSEPDNDFPNREGLASVCGIGKATLYQHFTPDELSQIEQEGLDIRRTKYKRELSNIDKALIKKAEEGDAQAIKLAYQRFECWNEKSLHEHSGPNGGPIETKFTIEFEKLKEMND